MKPYARASLAAAALLTALCGATASSAQSEAKKRIPPPKSDSTPARKPPAASQSRKPPAPPAQAVPRPRPPKSAPPRTPRHAPRPRETYLYPFVPFADFDFVYRFPYGVYPYSRYGYPYSPYRFVFPPPGCVTTETEAHGTLRLDVPQRDAAVFVDGFYVGVVDDFNGVAETLDLGPGPHHLELRAPGFESLTFDVNIEAGRTITYRTPMRPAESPATPRP